MEQLLLRERWREAITWHLTGSPLAAAGSTKFGAHTHNAIYNATQTREHFRLLECWSIMLCKHTLAMCARSIYVYVIHSKQSRIKYESIAYASRVSCQASRVSSSPPSMYEPEYERHIMCRDSRRQPLQRRRILMVLRPLLQFSLLCAATPYAFATAMSNDPIYSRRNT